MAPSLLRSYPDVRKLDYPMMREAGTRKDHRERASISEVPSWWLSCTDGSLRYSNISKQWEVIIPLTRRPLAFASQSTEPPWDASAPGVPQLPLLSD